MAATIDLAMVSALAQFFLHRFLQFISAMLPFFFTKDCTNSAWLSASLPFSAQLSANLSALHTILYPIEPNMNQIDTKGNIPASFRL
jgi:hypothetical protein